MPRRPKGDSEAEQLLKDVAHRKARETLKHYENTKNFIGAYVIIFSLFEDRLRALCVLYYRDVQKTDYREQLAFSLSKIIKGMKGEVLPEDIYKEAFDLAQKRNELIHEAHYSIDAFSQAHVDELKDIEAKVDAIRRKLKRKIAASNKQSTQSAAHTKH